jgi:hypothetical protein
VHQEVDLALFRMNKLATDRPTPTALFSAVAPPPAAVGRLVYLVGHPAWDGYRNDPIEMERIFTNIFDFKRLQPGIITGVDAARIELTHDCSTLGGNSGSCLVDMERHEVLGLHFGGRYLQDNYAIPLWQLRDDPLLVRAGVQFGPATQQ